MTYEEAVEKLTLMSRSQIADITPAECGEIARMLVDLERGFWLLEAEAQRLRAELAEKKP